MTRAGLSDTAQIVDMLNGQAEALCRELLPNGHRSGTKWMCSGVADTGRSASMYVHLTGLKIGHWRDLGNCAPGEEYGDMLDLLRLKLGLADQRAAFQEARARLGLADPVTGQARRISPEEAAARAEEARARAEARQAEEDREAEAKMRGARALYLNAEAVPIAGTPADLYLRGRILVPGGAGRWPRALRFHPAVWYAGARAKIPAMLAPIYRADGVQIGTHRTYLAQRGGQWGKIDAEDAKKVLGRQWGGFIPINKGASGRPMAKMPEGEPVYACEGIEDALVIRMVRPETRIIATINLGNMGALILPGAARRLVLVCDRDPHPKAQDKLESAIAAQQARGVRVELVFPPEEHKDMNDWLRALSASEAAA